MINRIFLISEYQSGAKPPDPTVYTAAPASAWDKESPCLSWLVDPSDQERLAGVYKLIDQSPFPTALALSIRQTLNAEQIRDLASFFFLPSYLKHFGQPVLIIIEDTSGPGPESVAALTAYLEQQGVPKPRLHLLTYPSQLQGEPMEHIAPVVSTPAGRSNHVFDSPDQLLEYYPRLLASDHFYDNDLYYFRQDSNEKESIRSLMESLRHIERQWRGSSPRLHDLTILYRQLQEEHESLRRRHQQTLTELTSQQQYAEILRSGHQAKEIQEYYDKEYETLPLWYKRFGHIIKVITGKRTLRSLFREDVKKYK